MYSKFSSRFVTGAAAALTISVGGFAMEGGIQNEAQGYEQQSDQFCRKQPKFEAYTCNKNGTKCERIEHWADFQFDVNGDITKTVFIETAKRFAQSGAEERPYHLDGEGNKKVCAPSFDACDNLQDQSQVPVGQAKTSDTQIFCGDVDGNLTADGGWTGCGKARERRVEKLTWTTGATKHKDYDLGEIEPTDFLAELDPVVQELYKHSGCNIDAMRAFLESAKDAGGFNLVAKICNKPSHRHKSKVKVLPSQTVQK